MVMLILNKIIDIDKYDLCNRYIFSASTAGETEI